MTYDDMAVMAANDTPAALMVSALATEGLQVFTVVEATGRSFPRAFGTLAQAQRYTQALATRWTESNPEDGQVTQSSHGLILRNAKGAYRFHIIPSTVSLGA